jgi:N-methylhydantoinase A
MTTEEAAFGAYRVACAQITDLIHEITVERGLDPREFVLHAFGGCCGMLAGVFGSDLHVKQIVVPYTASVNCAFGLASADIAHEYATTKTLPAGASPDEVNAIYEPMIARALKALAEEGFSERQVRLDRAVDLRYLRQVHEVTTPIRGNGSLNANVLERLVSDFEALYERKYGRGSAYREAGVEMTMFRLTARGVGERAKLEPILLAGSDASAACLGRRPVFVEQAGGFRDADIYDFNRLAPGNVLPGPAVIHTPITTIVLQANHVGRIDAYRNVLLDPA